MTAGAPGRLTDREGPTPAAMPAATNALDPGRHAAAKAGRTRRSEMPLARRCRPRGRRDVYSEDCARVRP